MNAFLRERNRLHEEAQRIGCRVPPIDFSTHPEDQDIILAAVLDEQEEHVQDQLTGPLDGSIRLQVSLQQLTTILHVGCSSRTDSRILLDKMCLRDDMWDILHCLLCSISFMMLRWNGWCNSRFHHNWQARIPEEVLWQPPDDESMSCSAWRLRGAHFPDIITSIATSEYLTKDDISNLVKLAANVKHQGYGLHDFEGTGAREWCKSNRYWLRKVEKMFEGSGWVKRTRDEFLIFKVRTLTILCADV
jgi:hypothetical protein